MNVIITLLDVAERRNVAPVPPALPLRPPLLIPKPLSDTRGGGAVILAPYHVASLLRKAIFAVNTLKHSHPAVWGVGRTLKLLDSPPAPRHEEKA
eukprot:CAMPEP_0173410238 /NCGR_PEP_ID=MMETSP1356-20130122/74149_1 /TAXON_ID=77927 ORGANISM="Hemiselmis virescens, Strain PCC157" /NCGR_SAMPLE_ID=MMETSP1356 /ASSEMBLY_ACC=CAM_ASM_000847 /LENGTH=94 /DNA_ID=CAMNT_0014371847 /DNA_START=213 /DNA_END=497 /DNA_ORIENTATION=-